MLNEFLGTFSNVSIALSLLIHRSWSDVITAFNSAVLGFSFSVYVSTHHWLHSCKLSLSPPPPLLIGGVWLWVSIKSWVEFNIPRAFYFKPFSWIRKSHIMPITSHSLPPLKKLCFQSWRVQNIGHFLTHFNATMTRRLPCVYHPLTAYHWLAWSVSVLHRPKENFNYSNFRKINFQKLITVREPHTSEGCETSVLISHVVSFSLRRRSDRIGNDQLLCPPRSRFSSRDHVCGEPHSELYGPTQSQS